ncbi:MAG: cation-transporting P-type ATPase [Rubrivivax sp.]
MSTPGASSPPDEKKGKDPKDPKVVLKTPPIAEVEKKLDASPDALSEAEAKKQLTQYGPNEIEEKKTNAILKFLGYFWGPIPLMIEVAVILSGAVAQQKPMPRKMPSRLPRLSPTADLMPQLVERLHKLYEELGRQDVLTVQALEKAQQADRDDGPKR